MRAALAGVRTFLFVSASESRDRADQQRAVVRAAVEAGVRRIVYVSFVGAGPECTFTFGRDHWWTEQEIRASGLDFTFLRDNFYQDMLPLLAGEDGVIRGPAGDGRIGAVARDDVADVAAAVLTATGHDGHTYDVTGPRAITLTEAAAMISDATGSTITYHPETLDEAYASRAGYGAEDWEVMRLGELLPGHGHRRARYRHRHRAPAHRPPRQGLRRAAGRHRTARRAMTAQVLVAPG